MSGITFVKLTECGLYNEYRTEITLSPRHIVKIQHGSDFSGEHYTVLTLSNNERLYVIGTVDDVLAQIDAAYRKPDADIGKAIDEVL